MSTYFTSGDRRGGRHLCSAVPILQAAAESLEVREGAARSYSVTGSVSGSRRRAFEFGRGEGGREAAATAVHGSLGSTS